MKCRARSEFSARPNPPALKFHRRANRIPRARAKNSSSAQNAAMKKNVRRGITAADVQDLSDVKRFGFTPGLAACNALNFTPNLRAMAASVSPAATVVRARRGRRRGICRMVCDRSLRRRGKWFAPAEPDLDLQLARRNYFAAADWFWTAAIGCVIRAPFVHFRPATAGFDPRVFPIAAAWRARWAWASRRRRAVVCRWRCAA